MILRRDSGKPAALSIENKRLFVFTDLDGTLLDPVSYDWRPAASAISEMRRRRIPLIFCTSKTRAEIEPLRREMSLQTPYIAESGGILAIPVSFLGWPYKFAGKTRQIVLRLGSRRSDVLRALSVLQRETKISVRGFQQMSPAQVSRETGLSLRQARRAQLRETSEPFQFVNASRKDMRAFQRAAKRRGFSVVEGDRFWHIGAGVDKGEAMHLLLLLAQVADPRPIFTIAVGDSLIDFPMLVRADVPVLMPKRSGAFNQHMLKTLPNAVLAPEAGPAGWAHTIRGTIRKWDHQSAGVFTSQRPVEAEDDPLTLAPHEFGPLPFPAFPSKPRAVRRTTALH